MFSRPAPRLYPIPFSQRDSRRFVDLPCSTRRALHAIETCRTAALGGHRDTCDTCGAVQVSYNSCRNRHCPKCQTLAKERWLDARRAELLPVEYHPTDRPGALGTHLEPVDRAAPPSAAPRTGLESP